MRGRRLGSGRGHGRYPDGRAGRGVLLEQGGLDLPDLFGRIRRWAAGGPKDIGLQTEDLLTSGEPWDIAAALHFQVNGRAAGNGPLMRAAMSAVYFARAEPMTTMAAARRIAALTHGDRTAWEGTAVLHEPIQVALNGGNPLAAVPGAGDTDTVAAVTGGLAGTCRNRAEAGRSPCTCRCRGTGTGCCGRLIWWT